MAHQKALEQTFEGYATISRPMVYAPFLNGFLVFN
jgi:hypothetical protein